MKMDKIVIEDGMTFEDIVGQLQATTPDMICVVDGTTLRIIKRTKDIPTNIRFSHKVRKNGIEGYYFRDAANDTLYCVFGREKALLFYPSLNLYNPVIRQKPTPPSDTVKTKFVLRHGKVLHEFDEVDNEVISQVRNI